MKSTDRRKHPRFETEVPVIIYTKDFNLSATLIDISEGGMGGFCEKAIHHGTSVYLSLKFISDYAIKGNVKWSFQIYQNQKRYYRMGFEAKNIIRTNLNTIGFAEGSELVAKILSATAKQN